MMKVVLAVDIVIVGVVLRVGIVIVGIALAVESVIMDVFNTVGIFHSLK